MCIWATVKLVGVKFSPDSNTRRFEFFRWFQLPVTCKLRVAIRLLHVKSMLIYLISTHCSGTLRFRISILWFIRIIRFTQTICKVSSDAFSIIVRRAEPSLNHLRIFSEKFHRKIPKSHQSNSSPQWLQEWFCWLVGRLIRSPGCIWECSNWLKAISNDSRSNF